MTCGGGGVAVSLLVGHRTCHLQVAGSSPGWASLSRGFVPISHTISKNFSFCCSVVVSPLDGTY